MRSRSKIIRPWSKEYNTLGIPHTLAPYPEAPSYGMLDQAARRYPKQGLIQNKTMLTYPKVRDIAYRLATALARLGLKKGDRVATLLPTSIPFVIADYAISRAGLVHVPCAAMEPVPGLTRKLKTCTPKALITLDETLPAAKSLAKGCGLAHVVVAKLSDYGPTPEPHPPITDFPCGAYWMTELTAITPCSPPDLDITPRTDLEMILFTGGTTGTAKGCMLSHRNIYCNALQNSWSFGRASRLFAGNISALIGLPLFHSYGHVIMHTMTLEGFNQILIPDARDTEAMVSMIETHAPLLQMGVPAQFMKMASAKLKNIAILGVSGSAPLPPSAQTDFEKSTSGAIMEGYGLSEMSPCTHLNPSLLLRVSGGRVAQRLLTLTLGVPGTIPLLRGLFRLMGPKAVGYSITRGIATLLKLTRASASKGDTPEKMGAAGIPLPDTLPCIAHPETGEPVACESFFSTSTRGEMYLKGPQRMRGYWPDEGSGIDTDGYIHTGDIVTMDPQGYFTIVDRTKDMINVSGFKVYSRELDDILYSHPAVEHAATIGVPDEKREGNERVIICLQPRASHKDRVTPEAFITFIKEHVAAYAVPKTIFFVDEMPMTNVQKLDKKKVRELALAHLNLKSIAPGNHES